VGLSFRYTFTESFLQGLSFYTSYRDVDQNISAEDPSLFLLDNVHDVIFGTEYNRGPLSATLEHENRDSTINPYDSTRFLARLEQKTGRESSVSADLTHEIIDYHDPSNHVEFDRVGARLAQRIGPDLDLNLRLVYRDERDRVSGDSRGFEELVEVRYRRRQTQMFVSFRNSQLDGSGSNTLSQTLQFGIRRAF